MSQLSVRNQQLRNRFNAVMSDNGLKLVWATGRMQLKNTSVSSWRGVQGFNFGDEKLDIIEDFVKGYEK